MGRGMLATALAWIFIYAQRGTEASSWIAVSSRAGVVAELKEGRFFAIEAEPGRHAFATAKGVPMVVEVGGEDVFLRLDWNFDVRRRPVAVFAKVDPERARSEMRFLSYVDAKRVRAAAVAKADPRVPAAPSLKTRP